MAMQIRMRNEKKRFCKRNIQVVRHGLFEGPRKWNKKTWKVLMMRRKKDESVLGMRRRVKEREDRSVGQVKGLPVVHDVYNVHDVHDVHDVHTEVQQYILDVRRHRRCTSRWVKGSVSKPERWMFVVASQQ